MKEGQNVIYYITVGSIAIVSSSPFLGNFGKKGLEVPPIVDPVEKHAVQKRKEFDGKKLKSTTKEGLDLGDEDEKKKLEELKAQFKPLTKLVKEVLVDKVEKVIVGDRIVDSPERIMKAQAPRDNSMTSPMVSKKPMQIQHSIITEL